MQHSGLTANQVACIDMTDAPTSATEAQRDDMMTMPLTEAKRRAASEFERRYLIHVMERAGGSVSRGARLSGLDRTNFRRLLQRHGLHGALDSRQISQPLA